MEATATERNLALAAAIAGSGMTSTSLAAAAGIHRVTVSRIICRRQHANEHTAATISKALGTTPYAIGLAGKGGAA